MKKKSLFVIVCVLFIVMISGCASSVQDGRTEEAYTSPAATTAGRSAAETGTEDFAPISFEGQDTAAMANRKVILHAYVEMEVEDFDAAYQRIRMLIAPFGYVQETSIRRNKHYPAGQTDYIYITGGTVVIRVDVNQFESVMGSFDDIGVVVKEDRRSDDITHRYVDTQARIRLLEDEKARLEQYLKDDTKDADFIFNVQSRMTDVLYEIENYKGNILRWDELMALSTITIRMEELVPGQKPRAEMTFFDRLARSFRSAIDITGEIVIFLISSIPVILLFGGLTIFIIWIIRKLKKPSVRKKQNVSTGSNPQSDNTNKS